MIEREWKGKPTALAVGFLFVSLTERLVPARSSRRLRPDKANVRRLIGAEYRILPEALDVILNQRVDPIVGVMRPAVQDRHHPRRLRRHLPVLQIVALRG